MKQASVHWLQGFAATAVLAASALAWAADTPTAAAGSAAATAESGKDEKPVPVTERVEQKAKTVAAATRHGVDKAIDATGRGLDKAGVAIERGADKAGLAIEQGADKAGQAVERVADKARVAVSRKNRKKVEPKKDDAAAAAKPD